MKACVCVCVCVCRGLKPDDSLVISYTRWLTNSPGPLHSGLPYSMSCYVDKTTAQQQLHCFDNFIEFILPNKCCIHSMGSLCVESITSGGLRV